MNKWNFFINICQLLNNNFTFQIPRGFDEDLNVNELLQVNLNTSSSLTEENSYKEEEEEDSFDEYVDDDESIPRNFSDSDDDYINSIKQGKS